MAVLIRNFFDHLEGFSEHGICHGIIKLHEYKLLNINDKKGLIYNRVGVTTFTSPDR